MKRFLCALAVVAVAAMPVVASAAVFASGPEYTSSAGQRIDGSIYAAGGTVSVGSAVSGDALVVGGTVSLTGHVSGDVAGIAGTLQVLGPVSGDARLVGGTITINDRVNGDLLVAGGTVHLLPGGTVGGDVYVTGGTVVIDGAVDGSVRVRAGTLTINGKVGGNVYARIGQRIALGDGASIRGDFAYRAPQMVTMGTGAVITGTVQYDAIHEVKGVRNAPRNVFWAVLGVITAVQTVMYLGATLVVMWRARRWTVGAFQDVRDAFWSHTGRGLAWLILVPIVTVLLLVSFVGTLVGVSLGLLFALGLVLVKVFAGMYLGSWFDATWHGHKALSVTWLNAILGTIAFHLLGLVPVVGWAVQTIIVLAVFGVLVERTRKHLSAIQ